MTPFAQELAALERNLFNEPMITLQHCRRLLARLRQNDDAEGQIRAAILLGLIEDQLGQQVGARAELLEALATCRRHHLLTLEPAIHERLGREFYTAGEYVPALRHWSFTLELGASVALSDELRCMSYIGLGHCCSAFGQTRLASRFHRAAMALAMPLGNIYLHSKAAISLGWTLRELGNSAEARSILQDALTECRTHDFRFFQPEILLRLAEIELEHGRQDEAENLAEEGLSLLVFTPSHWCEANLLGLLADLYARHEQLTLALDLIQRALRIVAEDRMTHVEARLCRQAAHYCAQLGEPVQAAAYRERVISLQSSNARHWQAPGELLAQLPGFLPPGA
ncbi:hypothetical protein [Chitinilyticum litopenaei]|uniref:hypothetical protein n=1 Tax=Chitinilyticum litopenaei TaxID=1121276 RepID=UPI000410ECB5|nr:hypothetical protein [Chitinilyticum litopenaei]